MHFIRIWLVFDNMAFGLKVQRLPKDEIKRRVW